VSAATSASRLLPADVLRVGGVGLRTRKLHAGLSALGIAIGIASMVAVLGISESSKSDLIAALDRLGTNLLTAAPGQTLFGDEAVLPDDAPTMIGRIGPVEQVSSAATVDGAVRRTDRIPEIETGGIGIRAVDTNLLRTLGGSAREGSFLTAATAPLSAVVLGAKAAERLGIERLHGVLQVWLGDRWFTVVGILDPLELAPDLDSAAFVGFPAARALLAHDGAVSTVYVRTDPDTIDDVRGVLAETANPEHPEEVDVGRPSDAIEARAAAKGAFTSLFLGLGAVALLVGGVGIANVMVISVLERRSEIGLRRALGATRRHISTQFLAESLLLAALGGTAGVLGGAAVTLAYAANRGWSPVLPPLVLGGGLLAALAIGAVAGLYPATRAARLSPTDALRTV
jgi:putative ABC transport system permease protein